MSYMRKRGALRAVVAIPIVSLLLVACWMVIRVAIAEYLSNTNSLSDRSLAARMFPSDADYQLRLAMLKITAKKDARPELRRAVQDSPQDASLWSRLADESQRWQDYDGAETQMLKAA